MKKTEYVDLKLLSSFVDEAPAKYFPAGVYESFSEREKLIARDFMSVITFLLTNNICNHEEACKIFSKIPLEHKKQDKVTMLF